MSQFENVEQFFNFVIFNFSSSILERLKQYRSANEGNKDVDCVCLIYNKVYNNDVKQTSFIIEIINITELEEYFKRPRVKNTFVEIDTDDYIKNINDSCNMKDNEIFISIFDILNAEGYSVLLNENDLRSIQTRYQIRKALTS